LQLFASLKIGGSRSLPQMTLPARRGFFANAQALVGLSLCGQRGGLPVALALDHHAQAMRAILLARAMATTLVADAQ